MILGKNCLKYSLKIESITVKESEEIELLEITIELKKKIKKIKHISTSFML